MTKEIVKYRVREIGQNEFLPDDTVYVTRPVTFVRDCQIPIYENGVLLSDVILSELGLEKIGFTQDELDREFYGGLYAVNPDLETRVRQYKNILEVLVLDEAATMDDIKTAILTVENIDDKAAFSIEAIAVYDAIITNLECCGSDTPHAAALEMLPKLIQYLPSVSDSDSPCPSDSAINPGD